MNKEIELIVHKQWGYFCPEQTTIVSLLDDKVTALLDGAAYCLRYEDKRKFLKKLEQVGVDKWNKSRWEPEGRIVCDGIEWSLSLCYADGSEKEYSGYEAYPPNYRKLMKLLGIE